MNLLDWKERPFVSLEKMVSYSALNKEMAKKYGLTVKAVEISNRDYGYRYQKFSSSQKMQPPPSSHRHICLGYLVVRKCGTPEQYETWMPNHVFEELYEISKS
ncbi:MAG: hypothetical protein PHX69_00885 [Simplicispira sp.]|uniref:hypothetical protein n=1 Tax=Simplicispira sp. TaxID=2015802 RepID=UPI00258C43B9|nr:hypothetical protein [Simplicispira sp.]MDD2690321.1 hypothetical protein [Simplicispira sp.]